MENEKTPEEKYAETLRKQEAKRKEIKKRNPEPLDEKIKQKKEKKNILFWGKYKLSLIIATIVIIGLAVGGIYSIVFMEYTYTDFNEFEIGGLSFNIPTDYPLDISGETGDAFFSKFVCEYESKYTSNGRTRTVEKTININAYVYKTKSLQQVVSSISSEGWDAKNDSYGSYSGYKLERFGHEGGWFIFEKDGKTVAIYYERKAIGQNMEKIIT